MRIEIPSLGDETARLGTCHVIPREPIISERHKWQMTCDIRDCTALGKLKRETRVRVQARVEIFYYDIQMKI